MNSLVAKNIIGADNKNGVPGRFPPIPAARLDTLVRSQPNLNVGRGLETKYGVNSADIDLLKVYMNNAMQQGIEVVDLPANQLVNIEKGNAGFYDNLRETKAWKVGARVSKFLAPQIAGFAAKAATVAVVGGGVAGPIVGAAGAGIAGFATGATRGALGLRAASHEEEDIFEFFGKNSNINDMYETQNKDKTFVRKGLSKWLNLGKNWALEPVYHFEERESKIVNFLNQSLNLQFQEESGTFRNPLVVNGALNNYFLNYPLNDVIDFSKDLYIQNGLLNALYSRKDLKPETKAILKAWIDTLSEISSMLNIIIIREKQNNYEYVAILNNISQRAKSEVMTFGSGSNQWKYGSRRGITNAGQAIVYNLGGQAIAGGIRRLIEHTRGFNVANTAAAQTNAQIGTDLNNNPDHVRIQSDLADLQRQLTQSNLAGGGASVTNVISQNAHDRALSTFSADYLNAAGMRNMGRWARVATIQTFQDQFKTNGMQLNGLLDQLANSSKAQSLGLSRDDLLKWIMNRGSIDGVYSAVGKNASVNLNVTDLLTRLQNGNYPWSSVVQGARANVDPRWLDLMKGAMGNIINIPGVGAISNATKISILEKIAQLQADDLRIVGNVRIDAIKDEVLFALTDDQKKEIALAGVEVLDMIIDICMAAAGAGVIAEEVGLNTRRRIHVTPLGVPAQGGVQGQPPPPQPNPQAGNPAIQPQGVPGVAPAVQAPTVPPIQIGQGVPSGQTPPLGANYFTNDRTISSMNLDSSVLDTEYSNSNRTLADEINSLMDQAGQKERNHLDILSINNSINTSAGTLSLDKSKSNDPISNALDKAKITSIEIDQYEGPDKIHIGETAVVQENLAHLEKRLRKFRVNGIDLLHFKDNGHFYRYKREAGAYVMEEISNDIIEVNGKKYRLEIKDNYLILSHEEALNPQLKDAKKINIRKRDYYVVESEVRAHDKAEVNYERLLITTGEETADNKFVDAENIFVYRIIEDRKDPVIVVFDADTNEFYLLNDKNNLETLPKDYRIRFNGNDYRLKKVKGKNPNLEFERIESLQEVLEREAGKRITVEKDIYILPDVDRLKLESKKVRLNTEDTNELPLEASTVRLLDENAEPIPDAAYLLLGTERYVVKKENGQVVIIWINGPVTTTLNSNVINLPEEGKTYRVDMYDSLGLQFTGINDVDTLLPVLTHSENSNIGAPQNADDRLRIIESRLEKSVMTVKDSQKDAIDVELSVTISEDERYLLLARLSLWYDKLISIDSEVVTSDALHNFDFSYEHNGTHITKALIDLGFGAEDGESIDLMEFINNPERLNRVRIELYLKKNFNWGDDYKNNWRAITQYFYHLINHIEIELAGDKSILHSMESIKDKGAYFVLEDGPVTPIESGIVMNLEFNSGVYDEKEKQFIFGRTTRLYDYAKSIFPDIESLLAELQSNPELAKEYAWEGKPLTELLNSELAKRGGDTIKVFDLVTDVEKLNFENIANNNFDDPDPKKEELKRQNYELAKKKFALMLWSIALSLEKNLSGVEFTTEREVDSEIKEGRNNIEQERNKYPEDKVKVILISEEDLSKATVATLNYNSPVENVDIKILAVEIIFNNINNFANFLDELVRRLKKDDSTDTNALKRAICNLILDNFITDDLVVKKGKTVTIHGKKERAIGALRIDINDDKLREVIDEIKKSYEGEATKESEKVLDKIEINEPVTQRFVINGRHEYKIAVTENGNLNTTRNEIQFEIITEDDLITINYNLLPKKPNDTVTKIVFDPSSDENSVAMGFAGDFRLEAKLISKKVSGIANKFVEATFEFYIDDSDRPFPSYEAPKEEDLNKTLSLKDARKRVYEENARYSQGDVTNIPIVDLGVTRQGTPTQTFQTIKPDLGSTQVSSANLGTETLNGAVSDVDFFDKDGAVDNREPVFSGGDIRFDNPEDVDFFTDLNKIDNPLRLEQLLEQANSQQVFDAIIARISQLTITPEQAYSFLLHFFAKNEVNQLNQSIATNMGKFSGYIRKDLTNFVFKPTVNNLINKMLDIMHIPQLQLYREKFLTKLFNMSETYNQRINEDVQPIVFENETGWTNWYLIFVDLQERQPFFRNPKNTQILYDFFYGFLTKSKKELISLLRPSIYSIYIDSLLDVFGENGLEWLKKEDFGIRK